MARRARILVWSLGVAIAVNLFFPLRWWHPYCRHQDGYAYYGFGTPLPYAEPTGVASMSYHIAPHIYAADIVILTVLIYILLDYGTRFLVIHWDQKVILNIGGALFLFIVAALQILSFSLEDWFPVAGLSSDDDADRYVEYRPAFMVDAKRDGLCY